VDGKASIGFEISTESPTGEKQGHGGMHDWQNSGSSTGDFGKALPVVM
jgi:hypothetical protein